MRQRRVVGELRSLDGRRDVVPLPHRVVEHPVAGAVRRGRAPRVEAEYGDAGERREAVGGLADHVAVHEPAMRRQRVQRHEGRHRRPVLGDGDLADETQPVGSVQRQRRPARRQHGASTDRLLALPDVFGGHPPSVSRSAPRPGVPTGRVPVSALRQPRAVRLALAVVGPGDDVRRRRTDLLVAAGTSVGLGRRGARHGPHQPVTVAARLAPHGATTHRGGVGRRGLFRATTVLTGHVLQCVRPAAGGLRRHRPGAGTRR